MPEIDEFRKIALQIEDDHYCGKHPMNVRLSLVIEQALRNAHNMAVEECANVAYNHKCGKSCEDRGLGVDCSAVITDAIRRLRRE